VKFGLSFASQPAMVPIAVEAERLGYDSVGFYDTPLVCSDPFVVSGLVAAQTERIRIGISVAIPYLRLPHVLATAATTLNEIAPGRITLGLGTGYTAAQTTGSKPDTWATMREHIEVCRSLMAGEETEALIKGERRTIRHLHPDLGYVNVKDPIPIYLSAVGPKGRRITAELADGLYTIIGGRRATGKELAPIISEFRRDAARYGKEEMPVMLITAMAVRDVDEAIDSNRLRAFQGPWVTSHLHGDLGASSADPRTPEPVRRATEAYAEMAAGMRQDAPWIENHRGHSVFVRPEEESLLDGDLLQAVCQIGRPEELIQEICDLEEAGVDQVIWQCIPGFEREVVRFAHEVVDPYRATYA
jgi:alkanesulfonate monooxygenase SsuD/methylene tetrahydromethanopterin reductase-like flavin-dependent oxidoreductase (luciferase family)